MTTLQQRIADLAITIGQDMKSLTARLGTLEQSPSISKSYVIKTFNILNEFSAPLLGQANYIPFAQTTVVGIILTNGRPVSSDLMVGLYKNNDLISFFSIPAGQISARYNNLQYVLTTSDIVSVSVVAGNGENFSLALIG
jgi:hypothetical protein